MMSPPPLARRSNAGARHGADKPLVRQRDTAQRKAPVSNQIHTTATFTHWIGGSESKRHSHFSPPSLPIQS